VHTGDCVRRMGEDLQAGAAAIGAGAALGPQQIALLAAIGRDRVMVRPRPRVLVLSTGSELIDVGHTPSFGEVTDSNSYLVAAAARDAGADARRVGIVPTRVKRRILLQRALYSLLQRDGGTLRGVLRVRGGSTRRRQCRHHNRKKVEGPESHCAPQPFLRTSATSGLSHAVSFSRISCVVSSFALLLIIAPTLQYFSSDN